MEEEGWSQGTQDRCDLQVKVHWKSLLQRDIRPPEDGDPGIIFFGANMFFFKQEKVVPYIPPMWKKGHLCYLDPLRCFKSPFNIKILGK